MAAASTTQRCCPTDSYSDIEKHDKTMTTTNTIKLQLNCRFTDFHSAEVEVEGEANAVLHLASLWFYDTEERRTEVQSCVI